MERHSEAEWPGYAHGGGGLRAVIEWAWTHVRERGRALVKAVRRERRRSAGIRALQALDDRLLRDIGVERGSIPAFVDCLLDERDGAARHPAPHRGGSGRPVRANRAVTSFAARAAGCGR